MPRPVTFPDAEGEFFGYEKFGIWLGGDRFVTGTRLLLNLVSLGATVSLAFLHGVRAGSKRQAIQKYQQLIGDEWGDWLAELFQLAKVDLGYEIPGIRPFASACAPSSKKHLILKTSFGRGATPHKITPYNFH